MKDFIKGSIKDILPLRCRAEIYNHSINTHTTESMSQRIRTSPKFYYKIRNIKYTPFLATLIATIFLLMIYTFLRMGFVIYNWDSWANTPIKQILMTFIYGVRFDLSGLLMVNAAIFGIYNLPGHPTRSRTFARILFTLFCIINLIGLFLTFVDYVYYHFTFRRATYEPFVLPLESLMLIPGMIYEYWHLALLIIVVGIGFVLVSKKLFFFLEKRIQYEFSFFKNTVFLLVLIGLIVLGIRGGLQSKPIRQSHAFFSSDRSLGYVTLNTPFNIILSLNQTSPVEQTLFLEEGDARQTIQDMLYRQGEYNLALDYPFLRQPQSIGTTKKYNVVVLIMESWSARHVGALGARPSPTPFFDTLASDGLLFTNFVSNGQRSIEVAPAILASLPHILNAPLIGSLSELDGFIGLGTIFARRGYTTSFHHGAKTGSMGFDAYSRLAGFEHYYGKEDIPALTKNDWDGVWGIYDHVFLIDMINRLDSFHEPFCSVLYTLQPHEPLSIPVKMKPLFASASSKTSYDQALRYSDFSLQTFFNQAKTKTWFDHTVFIIVGDHPYDALQNDFWSAFHVPMLIYAPALVKSKRDDSISSQVDIIPTLLDLLCFPDAHTSMGKSLLQSSKKRFAVVKYGSQYGLITDNFVFLSDLDATEGVYDYKHDSTLSRNLMKFIPEETNRFRKQLFSYLQEVTAAIKHDKICRTEDLKYQSRLRVRGDKIK